MSSQPIVGDVAITCSACGRDVEATPTASGVVDSIRCTCGNEVELEVNGYW